MIILDDQEPYIDFWEEWIDLMEIREANSQQWHDEHRARCNKMTQEERGEALNRSLDIIYAKHPEKDPRIAAN